jgi:hypothetical protein
MTEQAKNSGTGQEEQELWPGRYRAGAKVDNWKHRGHIYEDQIMTLFQVDMGDEEAKALLEPFGFTPEKDGEDYPYLVSQVEETFTEDQADELIAYLETLEGTTAWKKPAYKPIKGHAGAGAMAVGGNTDFYMFTEYDNYSLDFKAWGYYRVDYQEARPAPETILKREIQAMISDLSPDELQTVKAWLDEFIKNKQEE